LGILFTISWLNRWSYFSLGETHIFDIAPSFFDTSSLFLWSFHIFVSMGKLCEIVNKWDPRGSKARLFLIKRCLEKTSLTAQHFTSLQFFNKSLAVLTPLEGARKYNGIFDRKKWVAKRQKMTNFPNFHLSFNFICQKGHFSCLLYQGGWT
jgi:hypothetical protein